MRSHVCLCQCQCVCVCPFDFIHKISNIWEFRNTTINICFFFSSLLLFLFLFHMSLLIAVCCAVLCVPHIFGNFHALNNIASRVCFGYRNKPNVVYTVRHDCGQRVCVCHACVVCHAISSWMENTQLLSIGRICVFVYARVCDVYVIHRNCGSSWQLVPILHNTTAAAKSSSSSSSRSSSRSIGRSKVKKKNNSNKSNTSGDTVIVQSSWWRCAQREHRPERNKRSESHTQKKNNNKTANMSICWEQQIDDERFIGAVCWWWTVCNRENWLFELSCVQRTFGRKQRTVWESDKESERSERKGGRRATQQKEREKEWMNKSIRVLCWRSVVA